jgi:O-antigen/teichoic acid export membrane protein
MKRFRHLLFLDNSRAWMTVKGHAQGVGVLMAGRISEAFLQLAQIRIYSELLPVAQVGRLALIVSIATFFSSLFLTTAGSYMLRQFVEWSLERRVHHELRSYALYLISVPLIIAIVLAAAGAWTTMIATFSWMTLFLLVSTYIVLFGGEQAVIGFLNIVGRRRWYVVLSNLGVLIGMGLSTLLSLTVGRTAEMWQAGSIAGYSLLLPLAVWLLLRAHPKTDKPPAATPAAGFFSKQMVTYTVPLIATTMCFWAQTSGYRLGMERGADIATLGLFAVGLTLGTMPMSLAAKIANDYLTPFFYTKIAHQDDAGKISAWQDMAASYVAPLVMIAPLTAAGGPFLARILVGHQYWDYSWLAYIGAIFQLFIAIYSVYALLAQAARRNSLVLTPNIVSAVVILGGAMLLSKWQPLLGTGIALIVGAVVLVLGSALSLHRSYQFKFPWRAMRRPILCGLLGWAWVTLASILIPGPSVIVSLAILALMGIYISAASWWLVSQTSPDAVPAS